MAVKFLNNYGTNLAANITSAATSITVSSGTGQNFLGLLTGGDIYYMTLIQVGTQSPFEIVQVTAVAGDVLTVIRAQDGTTARAWNLGDAIEIRLPRIVLSAFTQTGVSFGTMAIQNANAVAITGGTITGVTITGSTIPNSNVSGLGTAALASASSFAGSGPVASTGITMNTSKLLGRTTASAGAIEEIAIGTGLTLLAGTLAATGGGGGASQPFLYTQFFPTF